MRGDGALTPDSFHIEPGRTLPHTYHAWHPILLGDISHDG